MKLKATKLPIPPSDCYKGLRCEDWVRLNNKLTIHVDKVPEELEEYVEKVEPKPKKEKE